MTGISRKIKEQVPTCQCVGVDPYGSILAQPESLNKTDVTGYQVEGIGYDFIPTVLDRSTVDSWVKTTDQEAFITAREMMSLEGLLCGGSSGAAMAGALAAAKKLKKGQRCVVILADSIRNYMTKHLSDSWMVDHGFMEATDKPSSGEWWFDLPVSSLPQKFPMTLSPAISCGDAIEIMNKEGFDQMPVIDEAGSVVGMVTEANVLTQLLRKKVNKTDAVSKVIYSQFRQVPTDTKIGKVSRILDKDHFVLVTSQQKCYTGTSESMTKTTVFSIVTRIDILNFIMSRNNEGSVGASAGVSPAPSSPTNAAKRQRQN